MQESARELNCLKMPDRTALNEVQYQAVTYGKGPLLLLAGPGSGKTFTIINRILYLLQTGVPPEKILVITYTRAAACSMQERFAGASRTAAPPVNFGTFHSFFFHILQTSCMIPTDKILNKAERKALLLPVLRHFGTAGDFSGAEETADRMLEAIEYYKNTLDRERAVKRLAPGWAEQFDNILDGYQKAMRKSRALDFEDMVFLCRELFLEMPNLRKEWQTRFSHILIDEFQDINPVQYETLRLLAPRHSNIFAVGDDDQAIYGFRGADPGCMKRFAEDYGAGQLLLGINYRSRADIVRLSLKIIEENKNRFEKKLRAAEEEAELPAVKSCRDREKVELPAERCRRDGEKPEVPAVKCTPVRDREEQYRCMLDALREAVRGGESCAVLFRTNAYLQGFGARMKREGLPCEIREKAPSIYEHSVAKDVLAYLTLAYGQGCREELLRVINKPVRYVSREAVAACGGSLGALAEYYKRGCTESGAAEALERLEGQLLRMGRMPLRLAVEYLYKAVGYEKYLKETVLSGRRQGEGGETPEERWQDYRELLDWLKEDAGGCADLTEWKRLQAAIGEDLQGRRKDGRAEGRRTEDRRMEGRVTGDKGMESQKGQGEKVDVRPVQLMTVHAAKGLEFDRVWIGDCNERVFPHGRLQDEEALEEERRIFYVAVTRAKKSLELLYLTGTKERPRQPSRFLQPVLQSILRR